MKDVIIIFKYKHFQVHLDEKPLTAAFSKHRAFACTNDTKHACELNYKQCARSPRHKSKFTVFS